MSPPARTPEKVSAEIRARTPDQISAEMTITRNRLADTIDELVYRVQPKTIVGRQLASIKASFMAEDGSLDTAKVARAAGLAVGLLAVVVAIRKIVG